METKVGRTFPVAELRTNWLLNISGSGPRVYVDWSLANIRSLLCSYIFIFLIFMKDLIYVPLTLGYVGECEEAGEEKEN